MGTVKDKVTPQSDKAKDIFSKVRDKFGKRKRNEIENLAEQFTALETTLRILIVQKENDLKNELSQQAENIEKMVKLRTMLSLIELAIYEADQYAEGNG